MASEHDVEEAFARVVKGREEEEQEVKNQDRRQGQVPATGQLGSAAARESKLLNCTVEELLQML